MLRARRTEPETRNRAATVTERYYIETIVAACALKMSLLNPDRKGGEYSLPTITSHFRARQ
jgi:hypothetical protein